MMCVVQLSLTHMTDLLRNPHANGKRAQEHPNRTAELYTNQPTPPSPIQALTHMNDLLRNPMQTESELKNTLTALLNSINGKAARGRVRFNLKFVRKDALLKASREHTVAEVTVDHGLGVPKDVQMTRYVHRRGRTCSGSRTVLIGIVVFKPST